MVYLWSSFPGIFIHNLTDAIVISSPDAGISELRTNIHGTGLNWYFEQYWFFAFMFLVCVLFISLQFIAQNGKHNNEKLVTIESDEDIFNKVELLYHAHDSGLITDLELEENKRETLNDFVERLKT